MHTTSISSCSAHPRRLRPPFIRLLAGRHLWDAPPLPLHSRVHPLTPFCLRSSSDDPLVWAAVRVRDPRPDHRCRRRHQRDEGRRRRRAGRRRPPRPPRRRPRLPMIPACQRPDGSQRSCCLAAACACRGLPGTDVHMAVAGRRAQPVAGRRLQSVPAGPTGRVLCAVPWSMAP